MARYKVKRKRRGLGYVYFQVPEGSPQIKIDSLTTGSNQTMSDIYGKYLTPELLASNPTKYAEYLKKRDDGIVKILDIWKVPYTRDDSFGSEKVNMTKAWIDAGYVDNPPQVANQDGIPINVQPPINYSDTPLSNTVILDQNNNVVPIQTVLADPNASVIITDEIADEVSPATPQAKDNTLLYVGAGILAIGAMMLMGGKKKTKTAMGAAVPKRRRKAVRKKK